MSRLLALLFVLSAALPAAGQDLRIFTRVYGRTDEPGDTEGRTPLAYSLTLFHAGRVYDFVTPAGEVCILDPANRSFTILSVDRKLATTANFDEIVHLLKLSRQETEKYAAELEQRGDRDAAASLRFQLDPEFERDYDAETRTLRLRAERLSYVVQCASVEHSDVLEAYLRYADWTARLNHVLHPRTPFPASRLALNDALRKRVVIPVAVELHTRRGDGLHLRAEHQLRWRLDAKDRSRIHQWESLLRDEHTRKVPFREYQKALLASSGK